MLSTSQALSGPWVANLRGWAFLAIPTSVLVLVQELENELPAGVVALSALLQWIASGAWALGIAAIARRIRGRVPPVPAALIWIGVGVIRGLVGAAVAAGSGHDPDWIYRVVFWTVVSCAWLPLLSYTAAQWEERKRLLASENTARDAIAASHARADEGETERRHRLAAAAEQSIGPSIDEVRSALRSPESILDRDEMKSIGDRIETITHRTNHIVEGQPLEPPSTATSHRPRVPLTAAVDFELSRPALAAGLTGLAFATLVLPDGMRAHGWLAMAENVLAVATATAVFAVLLVLVGRRPPHGVARIVASQLILLGAGVVVPLVILALPWDRLEAHDLLFLILLPYGFGIAGSVLPSAVGLAVSNRELETHVAELQDEAERLLDESRRREEASTRHLRVLLHDTINGRLAASAMTLNFLASGDMPAHDRDGLVARVVNELDAAAGALHALVVPPRSGDYAD